MVFEFLRLSIEVTDADFNAIYPEKIQTLSKRHWTPVRVAKTASEFLVSKPGARVLDIGSGAGKFCMIGAAHTKGYFTGVEQREDLVELAKKLSSMYRLRHVEYVHSNITAIDFRFYNAFYFYNPFYENVCGDSIDNAVRLDIKLYDVYSSYVAEQLSGLPVGARLAVYHASSTIVPQSFKLVDTLYSGSLNLWDKVF